MVIKKSNAILVAVATAVVFYFVGAFFPLSFIYSDLVTGDIGKAKTYRSVSSEDINAAMELLASSKDVQQSTITASLILSGRVMEMDSLAKASLKATEGIAELEGLHKKFEAVCVRTSNALEAFSRYNQEVSKVLDGKASKAYEQCANNAYIAFSVLENNLHNSGAMIDEIAAYLHNNQNKDLDALACAWIEFGAEDAFLSGSEKNYDKWKAVYANLCKGSVAPSMTFPNPQMVATRVASHVSNAICSPVVSNATGLSEEAFALNANCVMQSLANNERMQSLANNIESLSATIVMPIFRMPGMMPIFGGGLGDHAEAGAAADFNVMQNSFIENMKVISNSEINNFDLLEQASSYFLGTSSHKIGYAGVIPEYIN